MREKDYSEYTLTETQKYQLRRQGNRAVLLDYFSNTASFDPERKTFRIQVDDWNEDDWMDSFIEEDTEATAQRLGKMLQTPEEDDEETRQEEWAQNQTDAALFAKRYRVSNALMDDPLRNQDGRRKEPMPVNNVLSGATIVMRYGEGILDFVYADFRTATVEAMRYPLMWEALRKEYRAASSSPPADTEPEKVYNQTQEIVDHYFAYRDTLRVTKDILMQSLYTMICPPVFADETDSKALKHYYSYLRDLQKEYLELLEFCFDESFYPDLLGRRHPAERFYLYRDLHGYPVTMERAETAQFTSHYRTGQIMPYGMTTEEVIQRYSNPVPVTEGLREFAERYHAEPKKLSATLTFPHYLRVGYEFGRVDQILELEFTKLLEAGVQFRKCQRCGRYFILKGNFNPRYCDRIAEGETRNCQELAAQENFKKKAADRPALGVYDRCYRRYA
ncbi:MAG: hypothetical protein K2M15_07080, partial [Oscillospiraceae bacterium]|nr:hypothetical protein [Oscillospiraceae bacterium]